MFLASQVHPQFAIGPLFVVAGVRPDLGPVAIPISWSLTAPPGQRAADIAQDLFLLWPNELVESTAPGPPDPALVRELEERGFGVSGGGRLALGTRDQMQMGTGAPVTPLPEVASETDVRRLCSRPDEEPHRRGASQRRTLVYRGTRQLPSARRALGPLATVHHWEEEQHELEIELDGDRVSAVQSRVRRRASG